MTEFLQLMTLPFLACLLLAGIHVYLGIHVLARKVIFVDLALAQIAALGGVFGVLLGYDFHDDPWAVKAYSLAFALVGATIFSWTRARHERVPHEAIIGITYAVALAATILATAHLPHGGEDVRQLLAGSILWVRSETLIATGALYGAIAVVLAATHRRLLAISTDPERAHDAGVRVRTWDFVFYALFGFVVTSSVAIAGVLLVFAYLVIPAVLAMLFAERVGTRLAIGWICGTLVSFAGVAISYRSDLPSGPTIVVAFGVVLAIAAVAREIARSPHRGKTALRAIAGTALLFAFALGAWSFRKSEADESPRAQLESPEPTERYFVVDGAITDDTLWNELEESLRKRLDDDDPDVRSTAIELAVAREAVDWLADIHDRLGDEDDHVRESALRAIRHFRSDTSLAPLMAALQSETDEYLVVDIAHALIEVGDARGLPALVRSMDTCTIPQVRKEAWETLRVHTHPPIRFDPTHDADDPANDAAVSTLTEWIATGPEIHPH